MTTKLKPAERKKQILDGAVEQAKRVGYQHVTRDAIAASVGVSAGLINLHFSTMTQLKRDIMRAAVKRKILSIIAQGLAAGDAHARKAPDDLKRLALASLTN